MGIVSRVTALAVAWIAILVLAGTAGLYAWTGTAFSRKLDTSGLHTFTASATEESVERGEHMVRAIVKCVDCHGSDLSGNLMINDPAMGRIYAPNLTSGVGGISGDYSDSDWERAVRHGIARDGRRLLIMPSNEYQFLSDDDMRAVISYLRTIPAVDKESPKSSVGPVARVLFAAGKFPLFPADLVVHTGKQVESVAVDSTVAYGEYLGSVGCAGCHGMTYGGGPIPGTPPDWPAAPNLTPTGLANYDFAEFDKVLRTGERSDGTKLHPLMPIAATSLMTEVEMVALYKYLKELPPRPFGSR